MSALLGCTSGSEPSSELQTTGTSGQVVADGSPGVWELDRDERPTKSSTKFNVLVSRLDCNSGTTGQVIEPVVRRTNTQVVVTFQVSPNTEGAATCPSNNLVAYEVDLGEPLGERKLADGQCLKGDPTDASTLCDPSRWAP
jgi:hypothetical protein